MRRSAHKVFAGILSLATVNSFAATGDPIKNEPYKRPSIKMTILKTKKPNGMGINLVPAKQIFSDYVFSSNVNISASSATLSITDAASFAAGVGGKISFLGNYRSLGDVTEGGSIKINKDNATENNYGFNMTFSTQQHGVGLDERLRISSTGNIGIGTSNPAYLLDVRKSVASNYTAHIGNTNTTSGTSYGLYVSGGTNGSDYAFNVNNAAESSTLFTITGAGNIGVGNASPAQKFDVAGAIQTSGGAGLVIANSLSGFPGAGIVYGYIGRSDGSGSVYPWNANGTVVFQSESSPGSSGFAFATGATPSVKVSILGNGNMGIGTSEPSEKLSVNGNVRAKGVIVEQENWSDYVFAPDYKLRSLSSLDKFIKQNKHLPEIPSAEKVKENGIRLGDAQALLLKKIEELTLYVIQLEKTTAAQGKEIQKLKRKK